MKYGTQIVLAAAAMLLTLPGCASPDGAAAPVEAAPAEAVGTQPRAGEELLKSFVDNDAEKFLSLLPSVVREEFGTTGFEKTQASMREQLGTPIHYEFVFNLEHPKFTVSIWKIRFERDNFDHTKKIHQEALFRVVSGEIDGKERLLSFNFF